MKILILENGKTIHEMMASFKLKNRKISLLPNGGAKNAYLAMEIPDLVIADLTSIRGDEVELLIELKSSLITSFVPFLLITASQERISQRNPGGMEKYISSLTYYLTKPFTKDEFFALLDKISGKIDSINPW